MPNDFVHRRNIENFRKQIAAETDHKRRTTLRTLLAEELARGPSPKTSSGLG
jgi:hypothetical protein